MKPSEKPTIGLIGLGLIGSRVAAQLRHQGYPLFVWNRTPRPEPHFLSSPAEVAEAADVIQIFVNDGAALFSVLEMMIPSLTQEHIIINHATISPGETLKAAALVAKHGAQFLEAPFTGSRDAAAEGKLVYFVGGTSELLKSVRPILEVSAYQILMMGVVGTASYVKVATNMIMASQVEVLAEALEFLSLGGVPLQRLADGLQYSVANAGIFSMKMPQMIQGDFEPRFSAKNMLKDIQFALEGARHFGVELPVTAAAAEVFQKIVQGGLADADMAAVASQYDYSGKEEYLFPPEALTASSRVSKKLIDPASKKSFFNFLKKKEKRSAP